MQTRYLACKFLLNENSKFLEFGNCFPPTQHTSLNMGSKRKIGGKPPHTPEVEGYGDYKTMLAINSWEDVADSGDEFHLNRDKIFLDDGPVKKRRRKLQEQGVNALPSSV